MKSMKRIALGIVLCRALLLPCRAELPPISLEDLVARMKEGEEALQSMRLEVQTTLWEDVGDGRQDRPQDLVSRQFEEYRMRDRFAKEYCAVSRVPHHLLTKPAGLVPPVGPREIDAYDGTVRTQLMPPEGTISPNPAVISRGWHLNFLGLFRLSPNRSHWQELGEGSSWDIGSIGTAKHDGHECYTVLLRGKHNGGNSEAETYKLWIAPGLGFCVVRHQDPRPVVPSMERRRPDTAYYDFAEQAPGVWLPKRYEFRNTPGDCRALVTFRYLSVNRPIPLSEFIVRFPTGTTITDNRPGRGLFPDPLVALGIGLPLIAIIAAILHCRHRREPQSN